jgi:hypothetical protein
MDPIGFALEGFDGIGLVRSHDEGTPVDLKGVVFDGTPVDGPDDLRQWLVSRYSSQFLAVTAEKLLTYALGRPLDHRDMPLVRAIQRDAARDGGRFSALVLSIVRSQPFQMNVKTAAPAGAVDTAARNN